MGLSLIERCYTATLICHCYMLLESKCNILLSQLLIKNNRITFLLHCIIQLSLTCPTNSIKALQAKYKLKRLYYVECPQYSTQLEELTSVTDCQSDRQTDIPSYLVQCGVMMHNYVGHGKATHSFHVSTNNFVTTKSLSVHSKHIIKYLI